jgi:hypothetical protein
MSSGALYRVAEFRSDVSEIVLSPSSEVLTSLGPSMSDYRRGFKFVTVFIVTAPNYMPK